MFGLLLEIGPESINQIKGPNFTDSEFPSSRNYRL